MRDEGTWWDQALIDGLYLDAEVGQKRVGAGRKGEGRKEGWNGT
jgi:hypothetical protein